MSTLKKHRWSRLYRISLLGGLLWISGLGAFYIYTQTFAYSPCHTNIIVVLTGGRGRLETGYAMLEQGLGSQLFISGISPASVALLEDKYQNNSAIFFGHRARNTRENALETISWAQQQGATSLHLVTSRYHMPRSLIEFKHLSPELTVSPVAVEPEPLTGQALYTLRYYWLIFKEYHKFLMAWGRHTLQKIK